METEKKEKLDIFIIVGILLAAAAYHIAVSLFASEESVVNRGVAMAITSGLFFWLTGMLWIAYQRWQTTKQSRDLLNDVISSTGQEVVFVIDHHGTVILSNEAVELVFGYTQAGMVGQNMDVIYAKDSFGWDRSADMKKVMTNVGFYRGEVDGVTREGAHIVLEIAISVRHKGAGFVLLIRDITERKESETRLRLAKEEAEKQRGAKEQLLEKLEESYKRLRELELHRDSLVHMVCHDMKAPIQVLILQLDLLKDMVIEKLDNDEMESVDTLLVYTRQLEIMVNSMLDVSKLECGKLPLQPQTGDLLGMAREAISFVKLIGRDKHFSINAPDNPREFGFDCDIVHRILVNLLFNAVKCSPPDSRISVVISYEEDGVRVDVMDQGHGIAPDMMERIWDKFEQADDRQMRSGTTGLGLTFCKLAIEAHSGSIGVSSVVDEGSTFWFTLPYKCVIPRSPETKTETDRTVPAFG